MESHEYKLKNITDLCSFGADNKEPEIRITEIKSLMRFWWRALNVFNSSEEMIKKEEKIFGSFSSELGSKAFKSPITFRIIKSKINPNRYGYHRNIKGLKCFKSDNAEVIIKLTVEKRKIGNNEYCSESIDFYDSLFKLSLILGGIGRRSRRGCGVFKIEENLPIDDLKDAINEYMKKISVDQYYIFEGKCKDEFIKISRNRRDINKIKYPYVEEILISKKSIEEASFYENIKKAMKMCKIKKYKYNKHEAKKLACPVYVTCYKWKEKLYPIIIKLYNTCPSDNFNDYYNEFKEVIL